VSSDSDHNTHEVKPHILLYIIKMIVNYCYENSTETENGDKQEVQECKEETG
jgi:hypothetical protein